MFKPKGLFTAVYTHTYAYIYIYVHIYEYNDNANSHNTKDRYNCIHSYVDVRICCLSAMLMPRALQRHEGLPGGVVREFGTRRAQRRQEMEAEATSAESCLNLTCRGRVSVTYLLLPRSPFVHVP